MACSKTELACWAVCVPKVQRSKARRAWAPSVGHFT